MDTFEISNEAVSGVEAFGTCPVPDTARFARKYMGCCGIFALEVKT